MQLSAAIKSQLEAWVTSGLSLAEIQIKLGEALGSPITYMEARLAVDDCDLILKKQKPTTASPIIDNKPEEAPGKVHVSMDKIHRPGILANGSVTFSDGEKAQWQLDEYGRLGLIPTTKGYRPSAADTAEFQKTLQEVTRGLSLLSP